MAAGAPPGRSARRRTACRAGSARGRAAARARPRARDGRPPSTRPGRLRRRLHRSAPRVHRTAEERAAAVRPVGKGPKGAAMTDIGTEPSVEALASRLQGTIVRPGDADYDETRAVYNAMIDKRPALIVRAAGVDDVVAAVNYGREQGLDVAIRGGGHNGAGLASVDDGLVIDLRDLNGVEVDAATRTVVIEGGALFADVDAATNEHGLATPGGIISSTGAGGLMLGGGIGHLSRKAGLSIDHILGAGGVLADGRVVNADETENPDLYWAIRGGGGNFGVVTKIRARLHPIDTVVAGPMFWSLDDAADLLKWYRDFILEAPEELGGFFAFLSVPPAPPFPEELHLQKVAAVVWCWPAPADQADEA